MTPYHTRPTPLLSRASYHTRNEEKPLRVMETRKRRKERESTRLARGLGSTDSRLQVCAPTLECVKGA